MWHKEYIANGCNFPKKKSYPRFSEEQMRIAVDHFFEHGQCLARTVRALGYPNIDYLSKWVDMLEPERRIKRTNKGKITDDQKQEAVIDLITRKATAAEIVDKYNIKMKLGMLKVVIYIKNAR